MYLSIVIIILCIINIQISLRILISKKNMNGVEKSMYLRSVNIFRIIIITLKSLVIMFTIIIIIIIISFILL